MTKMYVAKAPHVKAFLHCEMANGATIVRRDIVNAHQSVRRSPELDLCITRNVPGVPVTDADGNEAPGVVWLNYLNGMPPAGKAFTMDVTSWMEDYKMVRNPMEDFQFNRFFDVIPEGGVTEYGTTSGRETVEVRGACRKDGSTARATLTRRAARTRTP